MGKGVHKFGDAAQVLQRSALPLLDLLLFAQTTERDRERLRETERDCERQRETERDMLTKDVFVLY